MIRRLVRVGAWLAAGVAVLAWPAAWLLGTQAETYQQISLLDADAIAVNRALRADDPPATPAEVYEIYGTPVGGPEAYLFVDPSRVLRPEEDPSLALLPKGPDDNPLQLQTVDHAARVASVVAAGAAVLLLGAAWMLRRQAAGRRASGLA